MKLFLGIDPGTTNTGWCVLNSDRSFYIGGTYVSTEEEPLYEVSKKIIESIFHSIPIDSLELFCAIERYVPYSGKFTKHSESVCELIGCISYGLRERGVHITKARSIDWKPAICKTLFLEEGFSNKETSFNKKYSIAVATHLSGKKYKVSHEADACGLAYYAYLLQRCQKC